MICDKKKKKNGKETNQGTLVIIQNNSIEYQKLSMAECKSGILWTDNLKTLKRLKQRKHSTNSPPPRPLISDQSGSWKETKGIMPDFKDALWKERFMEVEVGLKERMVKQETGEEWEWEAITVPELEVTREELMFPELGGARILGPKNLERLWLKK